MYRDRCNGTNLSIMDMMGAIIHAALAALARSAPSRKPRFFVFHFWDSFDDISTACCGLGIGTGVGSGTGTGGFVSSGRLGAGTISVSLGMSSSFMVYLPLGFSLLEER
jgi:hypothetical protein